MTPAEISYNKIMLWLDNCETVFDLRCADSMVELFGHFFKEDLKHRNILKDLKADKYQEIFNHGKH